MHVRPVVHSSRCIGEESKHKEREGIGDTIRYVAAKANGSASNGMMSSSLSESVSSSEAPKEGRRVPCLRSSKTTLQLAGTSAPACSRAVAISKFLLATATTRGDWPYRSRTFTAQAGSSSRSSSVTASLPFLAATWSRVEELFPVPGKSPSKWLTYLKRGQHDFDRTICVGLDVLFHEIVVVDLASDMNWAEAPVVLLLLVCAPTNEELEQAEVSLPRCIVHGRISGSISSFSVGTFKLLATIVVNCSAVVRTCAEEGHCCSDHRNRLLDGPVQWCAAVLVPSIHSVRVCKKQKAVDIGGSEVSGSDMERCLIVIVGGEEIGSLLHQQGSKLKS